MSAMTPSYQLRATGGGWTVDCQRCHRPVRHYKRLGAAFRWAQTALRAEGHTYRRCPTDPER